MPRIKAASASPARPSSIASAMSRPSAFSPGAGIFTDHSLQPCTCSSSAAIAIVLPVALVIARYMGVAPEVVMYASLVTAGMPFLLLIGAAPNAIAYDSKQFTTGEFFRHGVPMSLVLLVVLGLSVTLIWPLLGMPILVR